MRNFLSQVWHKMRIPIMIIFSQQSFRNSYVKQLSKRIKERATKLGTNNSNCRYLHMIEIYTIPKNFRKGIKVKTNVARVKDIKLACKTVTLPHASI